MAPIIPRIKNSLLAGFIADAATMPVHWIYDTTKLGQALGEKGVKAPEFHSPPATPFYSSKEFPGHYEVGQPSVYGEQAVMMLEYLSNNGGFKGGESFAEFMYGWFKKYTGRYDHATKEFLEKSEKLKAEKKSLYPLCGADDDQAMHSFKIPQLTMFYRDDPKYLEYVEQAVRAHQNKDITVAFGKAFAVLLKETSLGKSFQDAIGVLLKHSECTPVVKEATQYAWGQKRKAKYDAKGWDNDLIAWTNELSNLLVEKYGANETSRAYISKSCAYPGAYIVCLKIIGDTIETLGAATAALKTEGFLFGVRRNILYAGDNCGRTFLLGTLLNSIGCEVPTDMIEKFNDYEAIEKLTDSIKIS